MDGAMQAKLTGDATDKQHEMHMKNPKLPATLEKDIDRISEHVLALEKEGYNNALVPFSQHANTLKEEARESFYKIYEEIQHGKQILKEHFEKQELGHEPVPEESSFSLFEEAAQKIKEKSQESDFIPDDSQTFMVQMGVPWGFMDRSYEVGKGLLAEKNYNDALAVFHFLRLLHPEVFEYFLGEATCYQELGRIDEAIESYTMSLFLQPENPLIFFQLAHCFYRENEKESSLKALEICMNYANQQGGRDELLKEATNFKQILTSQKAA
jgi:tetratricopeptide (TPR) repeat protein